MTGTPVCPKRRAPPLRSIAVAAEAEEAEAQAPTSVFRGLPRGSASASIPLHLLAVSLDLGTLTRGDMPASPQHRTVRWQRLRLAILDRDLWTCQVQGCGTILTEGRTDPRSAVVDHKRPADLRPDLFSDWNNLWAVCRTCHAAFDGIEKRLTPDAEAIAKAKQRYRAPRPATYDADGWPVW